MLGAETENLYRRYIGHLNERRLELGEFVHETLTYNGAPMTRLEYQSLIAGDIAATPDLVFNIDLLVTNGEWIACRLVFECTPKAEFLGLRPNGKRVSFAEHVFYRLRDGKICEVRSLIDRHSLAAQLAA